MTQPFGIFFQCHKQPYATYEALKSARQHYPESTIVLLSDNGYNYSKMAEYFKCIYIHENENIPVTYSELDSGYHITNSKNLINRFSNAFKQIKEEYIMLLEDDVSINNKIIDTFKYDINGYCPNVFDIHRYKLKDKYPFLSENIVYHFSGHGGSVYHKVNILKYFNNIQVIDDILYNWKQYNFPSTICVDFLCSAIVLLNKGTIGSYEGHCDGFGGKHNHIKVQHQYKAYYNLPLPQHIIQLIE